MAAARAAVPGLNFEQLAAIRAGLAGGRRPKVLFTRAAGQMAGQVGQVVRLEDPQGADEWVVVRFGRDELPFSPADLAVPPRGAVTRRGATAGPPAAAAPAFVIDQPVVPVPREQRTAAAAVAGPLSEPARRSRPGPLKGPAGLTVTLAYADGEWTVAAHQGSRALARPYGIRPAEALKMVGLIDVPGVQQAVEQILAVERAQAERQAERLRAELAEIEARLAELRAAG